MKIFLVLVVISLVDRSIDAQLNDPIPVPCKINEDCSLLAKNQKDPTCKEGFCVCLNEQEKITNCTSLPIYLSEKLTLPLFYKPCRLNTECSFENSICNTSRSQCECIKGYVPSINKQQCLKMSQGLSSPCNEDNQCSFQPNTVCIGGQCICADGYQGVDNYCWKMAPFGSPCNRTEECSHVNGALCNDKKICSCGNNTFIDEHKRDCRAYSRKIGGYCESQEHCSMIKNSTCVDKKCQCPQGKHFVESRQSCIVDRRIDGPCTNNDDCYQLENDTFSLINTLECMGSLCDCKMNYRRQGDLCLNAGVSTSHFFLLVVLSSVLCALVH